MSLVALGWWRCLGLWFRPVALPGVGVLVGVSLGVGGPLGVGNGCDDASDGLLLPRETVGKPTMVVVAVRQAFNSKLLPQPQQQRPIHGGCQ